MSGSALFRLVIAAFLTVGVLFALVPYHYWGVLALVLKVTATTGTAVLTVWAYRRRRP